MAWTIVGALAAACLAASPAAAHDKYHLVTHEDADDTSAELSELRSDLMELRSSLKSAAAGSYDQGQPQGCIGGQCGAGNCQGHAPCDDCCMADCCEPCCSAGGAWVAAEVIWFRYHRADGARVGVADDEIAEFDFEATPRLTAGFVRSDGLGFRVRYWEFDHNAPAIEAGSRLDVDAEVVDFEVFDTICLGCAWNLEVAAGVRHADFLEVMTDAPTETRFNAFDGYGGVASAEVRRSLGMSGAVWVRTRAAILMNDKDIFNNNNGGLQNVRLIDVTVGMTEIAVGYDYVMPICGATSYYFARVQAEWQNWYNFSSGFEDTENNEDFAGPADVGFGGFGIAVGIAR